MTPRTIPEQSSTDSRDKERNVARLVAASLVVAGLGASATLLRPSTTLAAQLKLPDSTYTYTVINQDLPGWCVDARGAEDAELRILRGDGNHGF